MSIVSPDQVNRQKQDLEDAARLAQHRAGVRLEHGSRKKGTKKGTKGQLVTTVLVIAALMGTVILLSQFGIL